MSYCQVEPSRSPSKDAEQHRKTVAGISVNDGSSVATHPRSAEHPIEAA
jgi:hypothetical protein